jgi:hypothetical protein
MQAVVRQDPSHLVLATFEAMPVRDPSHRARLTTHFRKSSRNRLGITSRGFTSSYQGRFVTSGQDSTVGVPKIL